MVPSDQSLRAGETPASEIDLRLELQEQQPVLKKHFFAPAGATALRERR
ncbi:hypothetical protein [Rhizobium leguminosarum]